MAPATDWDLALYIPPGALQGCKNGTTNHGCRLHANSPFLHMNELLRVTLSTCDNASCDAVEMVLVQSLSPTLTTRAV